MRPLHAQTQLDRLDLENHPALALLAPADAVLEALVLALRAHHHRLEHYPAMPDPWDLPLRRAQNIAALARALQAALFDYHDDQLDRIRQQQQSRIPF
jgi:hypothetical protein